MKLILKASAALAASAAILSFAGATFAQDNEAGPPRQPPTAEQRAAWRQQHEAERGQHLASALNLRPDQQPALQAFLAAMASSHEGREGRHHEDGDAAQLTTPQRLDRMADMLARRDAEFHRRADAIRSFYAALTPEQQRAFDAMPMMMGGHHQHGEHNGDRDGPPPPAAG